MIFFAVRMQAGKAAHRIQFVGFEIGRAGVSLVGVLMHPRTSHVVLARP